MAEFRMPSLGADMTEGTLCAWRRKPGDRVDRGDIIAEVETEKGVIEVEVFESGVVERLLVEPGARVPVGTPLAVVGEGPAQPAAPPPKAAEAPPAHETAPAPAPAARPSEAEVPIRDVSAPAAAPKAPATARQTPSARRLARESGVDLRRVQGTGGHGTVTREDVRRALASRASSVQKEPRAASRRPVSPLARRRARTLGVDLQSVQPSADGVVHLRDVERAAQHVERGGARGMRRVIAASMARSKREIPHYYLSTSIDVSPALGWLAAQNAQRQVTERLIPGVLLLKAASLAMHEVPELNAHWTGESAPPINRVHLGVAISLRQGGLIAPAIHDADRLSITELMDAFKDLVARARRGALRSSEMAEATATVTSLGDRGVETVFPIIRPPQVAMVGFGKIAERPWVVDGEVVARKLVTATLAADHRVSDGHRGGLYLAAVERLLQSPEDL